MDVMPVNESKLSGAWKHYSFIELVSDWLLIYRLDDDAIVLVRVAMRDEVFEIL